MLNEFLDSFRKDKSIIGAILVGSQAVNNQNKFSDTDVFLITNSSKKYLIKGSKKIDNDWFEYFMGNTNVVKRNIENEYKQNLKKTARMFATGKIIFEKDEVLTNLKKYSEKILSKQFKTMGDRWIKEKITSMYFRLDDLRDLKENNCKSYNFVYFNNLLDIANNFNLFNKHETIHKTKIYKIYTDKVFRKNYAIKISDDKKFVKLFCKCIENINQIEIEEFTKYVVNKMGGMKNYAVKKLIN